MALADSLARTAQGHALVDGHVVAHFRRLADHDAEGVVDEDPSPDERTGVDVDAGEDARGPRHGPRRGAPVAHPESVRHPVGPQGVQARVGEGGLEEPARGRVAFAHRREVLADVAEH